MLPGHAEESHGRKTITTIINIKKKTYTAI